MTTDKPKPCAVVSAIIEKIENGQRYVFVQTRWKPQASPNYLGVLEIPAGGIDSYENVYDAIRREVYEETGLEITRFIDDDRTSVIEARPGDTSLAFRPFLCQQVLETNGGLPWVGFVFRCEATGTLIMEPSEAKDPRWMTIDELDQILTKTPGKIFSLQVATLRYYIDTVRSE
jgi:8-oxo-dGTP pyrophosphatase MutT (NUDIX family)